MRNLLPPLKLQLILHPYLILCICAMCTEQCTLVHVSDFQPLTFRFYGGGDFTLFSYYVYVKCLKMYLTKNFKFKNDDKYGCF